MPYNNDDQLFTKRYVTEADGNKFKRPVQDDPFQTTEQAMRTLYGGQDPYSIPIGNRLSITPELSYDMIKESEGLTDVDITRRTFGAGVNTPMGTFKAGKNLFNADVDFPEGQEEYKGKGYYLGYGRHNKKGYGVDVNFRVEPGQEGQRTSWNIHANAVWDSGQLLGTIIKAFKELAD